MNVVIFGASGATGQHAVRHALRAGHRVTAFVREPARLAQRHPALSVLAGDVMRPATLAPALAGQDAVLCLLGTFPENKADRSRRQRGVPVCSEGTQNILAAMAEAGVARIVVLSSASVGESRHTGPAPLAWLVRRLLREVMDDKELQEATLRTSAAHWTIVRPARLDDRAATGRVRSGEALRWGFATTSRDDVAQLMVALLADETSVGRALTVV